MIADSPTPPDVTGDLKHRILAAVRSEPASTRRSARRRNLLLLANGGAVALAIFLGFGGARPFARPTLLIAATCGGWIAAAAVAMRIAFARGGSMVCRSTASLVALVVASPFVLFAWKIAVTTPFGTAMLESWTGHPGLLCLAMSLGMGLALLIVLVAARRRTDPVRPGIGGAALGMAAGISAGSFVDLWCPVASVPHVLLGHILPLVVLAGLGALAGRRFVRV